MGNPADLDGVSKLAYDAISDATSVENALLRLTRLVEALEHVANETVEADSEIELKELRSWVDAVRRRFTLFQSQLAPLGWALGPYVQDTGHYLIIATALEKEALTPEQADRGLADWLLRYGDHELLLNRIASTPLRAVWRWSWIAGEAMAATLHNHSAISAYGWMVVAEGMWRDLENHRTGSRPRSFYTSHSKGRARRLGKRLPWPETSLSAAQSMLGDQSTELVDEPIGAAQTNRHGFLHGNIAGFVGIHHAVKAMTVVDAIVDMARTYADELDEERLEAPPWESPELPIASDPIKHGLLPGLPPITPPRSDM